MCRDSSLSKAQVQQQLRVSAVCPSPTCSHSLTLSRLTLTADHHVPWPLATILVYTDNCLFSIKQQVASRRVPLLLSPSRCHSNTSERSPF